MNSNNGEIELMEFEGSSFNILADVGEGYYFSYEAFQFRLLWPQ